ncbi:hypothetical protein MCOR02_000892 [Pyricularia oryzae]|nr:hypothetical protein MCOR02_000892 [Pyricularia oryzae]KAI6487862.1 hypothetical protein MCOR13_009134 [Pyricularia oryzae]
MQEIVVGIDFGTTFSGVSWAINHGKKSIRLIQNWPKTGAINNNDVKVPTTIVYDSTGKPANWGYTIGFKEESLRWFKILLEADPRYSDKAREIHETRILLENLGKTPVEVAGDYLGKIWEYTQKDIRRHMGCDGWQQDCEILFVVTVPAVWSASAKQKTLDAAAAAGLGPRIQLLTEPQAAALAALEEMEDQDRLKIGEAFTICDAGGGTVDLISYVVTDTNPVRIRECAVGDGDLCGSVYINHAFEKDLKLRVGERQYKSIQRARRRKMLLDFDTVKQSYEGDPTKDFEVDLKGVQDSKENGIEDETIAISASTMRTVFDHVCGQIENLIQKQLQSAILLVGGFGESKYLYHRLEESYQSCGIRVIQAQGAWSAICRGATLWGLSRSSPTLAPMVTSVKSRVSYGMCVREPYEANVHLEEDLVFDEENWEWMADNQMNWLLQRGDTIEEGKQLQLSVFRNVAFEEKKLFSPTVPTFTELTFDVTLWVSHTDNPPSRANDSCKELVSVNVTLTRAQIKDFGHKFKSKKDKSTWRRVDYTVVMTLNNSHFEITVNCRGQDITSFNTEYVEE